MNPLEYKIIEVLNAVHPTEHLTYEELFIQVKESYEMAFSKGSFDICLERVLRKGKVLELRAFKVSTTT